MKGDERRRRRKADRNGQLAILEALRGEGHTVVSFTPWHYRIDGQLDVYPTRRRWHWLPTGERGEYGQITDVVDRFLAPSKRTRELAEIAKNHHALIKLLAAWSDEDILQALVARRTS